MAEKTINKSRILVIDDNDQIRETLIDLLEFEGYDVEGAQNGYIGMEKATEIVPDVILLDVMMPGIDGFEVCRKIREDEKLSEVPILIITALDDKKSKITAIEAGADDFIAKPFDRTELKARLKTITRLNRFRKLHSVRYEKMVLNKLLSKEKELNELKTQFISMVSHEFKTPLTAINLAATNLKKYWNKLDENSRNQKLDKILMQSKQITGMVENVLQSGEIEMKNLDYNPQTFKFVEFFRPLIDEVTHVFKYSHKINLELSDENGLIFIDPEQGRNIFINLLTNAIKFSPDSDKVDIYVSFDEQYTIIKVQDYGIGISKKNLKTIFEPFRRAKNVTNIPGTGLGLPIVKECVLLHNGKVSVSSDPGKGTTFKVKLPTNKNTDLK